MTKSKTSRLAALLKKIGPVRPDEPVGVVDIGSNSVRLVGYSGTARTPLPIYNERAFCRLGSSVAATGRIEGAPYDLARQTFIRFRAIADQLGIEKLSVFATAAVRAAKNKEEFVAEASKIFRNPVRVLEGMEEAHLTSHGVMMAIPHADGIVADLGGGSLELAHVRGGKILNATSLDMGVLMLARETTDVSAAMKKKIKQELKNIAWLSRAKGKALYAVGGTWRSLASVHMAQKAYGLPVLHQYEMECSESRAFLRVIAGLSEKASATLEAASKNRRQSLPIAAQILLNLTEATGAKNIVISATGVREGVLVETLLPSGYRETDPLLLACEEMAERMSKSHKYGYDLDDWTSGLFRGHGRSRELNRFRRAACLVSDIAWSQHPRSRAEIASQTVLRAPFNGISHEGRVLMAYALAHRHEVNNALPLLAGLPRFAEAERAGRILGLCFRLAHSLTASMPGMLPLTQLSFSAADITLDLRRLPPALYAPIVENRLQHLAEAIGVKPVILLPEV